MTPATQRAIQRELDRARKQYPTNDKLLKTFGEFAGRLMISFQRHTNRECAAVDVYDQAIICAALAIRLCQEGDAHYRYRQYDVIKIDTPQLDLLAGSVGGSSPSGLPDPGKSS